MSKPNATVISIRNPTIEALTEVFVGFIETNGLGLSFMAPDIARDIYYNYFPENTHKSGKIRKNKNGNVYERAEKNIEYFVQNRTMRPFTKKQATVQMEELKEQLIKAIFLFDTLNQTTKTALEYFGYNTVKRVEIRLLLLSLASAAERSVEEGLIPDAVGRGARPKASSRVALRLAEHYTGMCGRFPSRAVNFGEESGLFFGLVRDVFFALGIEDSAASRARDAIDEFHEQRLANEQRAAQHNLEIARIHRHLRNPQASAEIYMEEIAEKKID